MMSVPFTPQPLVSDSHPQNRWLLFCCPLAPSRYPKLEHGGYE